MSDKKLTTGEAFGRLFKDLVANGVPEPIAGDIVRDAAIDGIRESGWVLREEDNR